MTWRRTYRQLAFNCAVVATAQLLVACPLRAQAAVVAGELRRWHAVEVRFSGPSHSESDNNPNPFLDYRLICTFTGPSGQVYDVPGFFDTNGAGGGSGNVWKCRISPDEPGTWQYSASFRQGSQVAVSLAGNPGSATSFDGESGSFVVAESNKSGRDFRAPGHGRLVNAGGHYLRYVGGGGRFIKGATDVPENFFGYAGFDNTPNAGHDFDQHVQDWSSGDPDWGGGSGRAIIGALNYLASTGANGFYFLPMNVDGDGNDTFPTRAAYDKTHYDTSKLLQWEIVFSHADKLGVFLHFQLAETEPGNEEYHDGGTLGPQRKLYYRELIARFGHHLGMELDLGEENDYGTARRKEFAAFIKAVDPYDHPVATHARTDQMENYYAPLLGSDDFDITSFQISEGGLANGDAVEEWRSRSAAAGAPWVISIDEPQQIHNDPTDNSLGYPHGRMDFLWPIYMSGGGGFEWYVQQDGGGHSFDQEVDDLRELDTALTWTGHAISFMHAMPFWEMTPDDDLGGSSGSGATQVLAETGESYALYNAAGGTFSLNLAGQSGSFTVDWFHPRNGTWHSAGTVSGGSTVSLGSAPFGGDAAVLVRRLVPPCASDSECDDGNLCTDDTCDASSRCRHAATRQPSETCFAAGKTQLQVKDSADPAKRRLKWKWSKGTAFDQIALGGPDTTTRYALCVYDTSASVPSLVTSLDVDPGSLWQSNAPKGWKYSDKLGASDGVRKVQLKTGIDDKTQAQIRAQGESLPQPINANRYFSHSPSVVAQLISSEGTCWTSEFVAAGTQKNDGTQFKAKGP